MNPLIDDLLGGTFGELLVQIRLLQYGVQAVAPHKDTGNDLLALRAREFRALQIKTTSKYPAKFNYKDTMKREWDLLAIVVIGKAHADAWNNIDVKLDDCAIYILRRPEVTKGSWPKKELAPFAISLARTDVCFK